MIHKIIKTEILLLVILFGNKFEIGILGIFGDIVGFEIISGLGAKIFKGIQVVVHHNKDIFDMIKKYVYIFIRSAIDFADHKFF